MMAASASATNVVNGNYYGNSSGADGGTETYSGSSGGGSSSSWSNSYSGNWGDSYSETLNSGPGFYSGYYTGYGTSYYGGGPGVSSGPGGGGGPGQVIAYADGAPEVSAYAEGFQTSAGGPGVPSPGNDGIFNAGAAVSASTYPATRAELEIPAGVGPSTNPSPGGANNFNGVTAQQAAPGTPAATPTESSAQASSGQTWTEWFRSLFGGGTPSSQPASQKPAKNNLRDARGDLLDLANEHLPANDPTRAANANQILPNSELSAAIDTVGNVLTGKEQAITKGEAILYAKGVPKAALGYAEGIVIDFPKETVELGKDLITKGPKQMAEETGTVIGELIGSEDKRQEAMEGMKQAVSEALDDPRKGGRFIGKTTAEALSGKFIAGKLGKVAQQLRTKLRGLNSALDAAEDAGDMEKYFRILNNIGCFSAGTKVWLSALPSAAASLGNEVAGYAAAVTCRAGHESSSVLEATALTCAIECIPLGARTPTINPRPEEDELGLPDVDAATWQQIEIHFIRRDGAKVQIELLRPDWWVTKRSLREGGVLGISVPELEVLGRATVLAIKPCPELAEGDGAVVTGRYATFSATRVSHVVFEGGVELTGTPNHPVWSHDQNDWIGLGELRIGERVSTEAGATRVMSSVTSQEPTPVYNIEVHGEHVYAVTNLGIIVHNGLATDECTEYRKMLERVDDLTPDERAIFEDYVRRAGPDDAIAPPKDIDSEIDASDPDYDPEFHGSPEGKGGANSKVREAAARGSTLHSDKPGHLPDQLRQKYPDTEFEFTNSGVAGQDVKVVGGTHPSDYPGSKWPKDVDHADFKPDTAGGKKTFESDQRNKWPETTEMLPYDPETGTLR